MIIFFTGTGNSRIIAEKIAEVTGDEIINSFEPIRNRTYINYHSDRPWVFVAPTYAWRIPKLFEEFLRKSQFEGNDKAYFVMTCGDDIGNAAGYLKKICDEKKLSFMGVKEVIMPENYTAMFPVPDKRETERIVAAGIHSAEKIAEKILKEERIGRDSVSVADRIKSTIVNGPFYAFCVKAKAFHAEDSCVGCGHCEKVCPLVNIKMVDGKPCWGEVCTHCMACINSCPEKAIEYGKKSQGKPRIYDGEAR